MILKKTQKKPVLPKKCDLCQEPIGLYKPWYTVYVDPHFSNVSIEIGMTVLCPECFRSYENFLYSRKTGVIHEREVRESIST